MRAIEQAGTHDLGGGRVVGRMGFGAMRVTGEGVWGDPPDPEAAKRLLRRVVELGVTFLDTADSYGPETSERLLGEALAPWGDDVVVATKAGFDRPGPGEWRMNGNPDHIRAACEGSLQRLRLDTVPLYQLHRLDPAYPVADQVGAMLDLQAAGKIERIGLSEVSVAQLREVQSMCTVASVQNRYHVGDREWDDVVDACEQDGIAFIPWYPLGAGDLGEVGTALDEVAAAHGATRFGVALAWLLHRSPVMVPIPGTSSIPHLEESVAAAALLSEITDAEWARLDGLGAA